MAQLIDQNVYFVADMMVVLQFEFVLDVDTNFFCMVCDVCRCQLFYYLRSGLIT